MRKYLRDGQVSAVSAGAHMEPQLALCMKRPSKLDPFKAYITGQIEAAKPDILPLEPILAQDTVFGEDWQSIYNHLI